MMRPGDRATSATALAIVTATVHEDLDALNAITATLTPADYPALVTAMAALAAGIIDATAEFLHCDVDKILGRFGVLIVNSTKLRDPEVGA